MNSLQSFIDEQTKSVVSFCTNCTCSLIDAKKKDCCKKYKKGKRCKSCPKG